MRTLPILLTASLLTGCAHPDRGHYGYQDVGQAAVVEFGTVASEREVEITGRNSGIGAIAGATGGAIGGSYFGSGGGSLGAALAGALIAGIAGAAVEQAASDHKGIEYLITLENGKSETIVQNEEKPIPVGSRVMVQTRGQYQRVLPSAEGV